MVGSNRPWGDCTIGSAATDSLLAAHRQPIDSYGRARYSATELEVISDIGDIEKHLLQISGHGDLFNGIGKFSTRNPKSGRAAGIVACHQVGSMSQELGHVKTVFNLRNDLLRGLCARLQEIIPWTDSGRSRQSARSVAGCLQAELFRRVRVQQIRLEDAVLNHDGAPRGNALTVKRAGAEAARYGTVVDHVDAIARNLLPHFAR